MTGPVVRRLVAAAIAAVVVAASLLAVPAPKSHALDCPVPASGHWTGTGFGVIAGGPFPIESQSNYHANGTIDGFASANGGPFNPFTGTLVCDVITFGTVSPATTFTGTLAADGRSASGSYSLPGDTGTWTLTADPYSLAATATVLPTQIGPGGASSWVMDVENNGTAAATRVEAVFNVSGSGAFANVSAASVTQGSGCALGIVSTTIRCDLGTILAGAAASASVVLVSTGVAGSSIQGDGTAASLVGGGTDATAPQVTVSVVGPASLPPGEASGIAFPGQSFVTPGKATADNIMVAQFKLPRRVAAGSTTALALAPVGQLRSRAITLASSTGAVKATGQRALALPGAATVIPPPVPMSISRSASEATTFCGGSACSGEVLSLTSFSGYNDPKRPAKLTITWDATVKGNGKFSQIFKRGDSVKSPTQVVPPCSKLQGAYINLPCVLKGKDLRNGDTQFIILLLSGDPRFARR